VECVVIAVETLTTSCSMTTNIPKVAVVAKVNTFPMMMITTVMAIKIVIVAAVPAKCQLAILKVT